MYASRLKWKKSERATNGGSVQHWTLRRSMRGKKGAAAAGGAAAGGKASHSPAPAAAKPAKRNSIVNTVRKSLGRSKKSAPAAAPAGDNDITVSETLIGGGLKGVEVIDNTSGARVKVAYHGGNLCSYRATDGKEKLFHSKKAKTDMSKPLRGGVPVVFPQFGAGPLSQHGFARTSMWTLCDGELAPRMEDGMVHLAMSLKSNKETMKQWPFKFELVHHIRFGPKELETSMNIINRDSKPFDFQALLHTYLKFKNINQATIEGLEGLRYVDKLEYVVPGEPRQVWVEKSNKLKVASEVDNIYYNAENAPIVITSPADNSRVEIHMALCRGDEMTDCDAVMWNPGTGKGNRMADFSMPEWQSMLCIEPGCASRTEVCQPGETWTVTQNIKFGRISKYGVRNA
mmetsp:Transcript_6533/g.21125  ORF Transcript_6533/g.21125 Transcript_6533/m.21125 type:complete len:401 (+) Transcript_6533:74-1276(+)|eukprot:CAMPEP_0202093960 /NCGR_PEP_ID=MMETSP0964-20121228/48785_1 /ASSEMBLY_ACC=CAM_ASM_000500 /TAXON_ID=4773 /ORGANISM="Schizochytrium aggregatum, Strain ATCC28209" /LENGTH=400 /DNA_ID=CAMNT_0048662213 /DNA_START=41 /DNA_END=1243 /DNA_ORIENTATION=-